MEIVASRSQLKKVLEGYWQQRQAIGFVPTMGALHDGHLTLIQRAQSENEIVVVSIFVNPTQFGPNEDYNSYPRPLEQDLTALEELGVTVVFVPGIENIYPTPATVFFTAPELTNRLCGRSRPGHFEGVMQVVSRLFHLVKPNRVYFGQKDFQQTVVIRRMLADLFWDEDINMVVCATQREPDGLAMSSRNRYLTPDQRVIAPKFYQILQQVASAARTNPNVQQLTDRAKIELTKAGFVVDYVELVAQDNLAALTEVIPNKTALVAAVYLGSTRLIDNLLF